MQSFLIRIMVVNASVSNYENRFFVFVLVWHCKRLCIIWCIHQYRFSIRLSFYIENLMDTTQKIEIVTKFYINKYPYYITTFSSKHIVHHYTFMFWTKINGNVPIWITDCKRWSMFWNIFLQRLDTKIINLKSLYSSEWNFRINTHKMSRSLVMCAQTFMY